MFGRVGVVWRYVKEICFRILEFERMRVELSFYLGLEGVWVGVFEEESLEVDFVES